MNIFWTASNRSTVKGTILLLQLCIQSLLETNARSLRVILGEKITFSWYHENGSFRVQYFNQHYLAEMDAMRASGLIPVNPIIVINKDTQLPMYIVEQAIIY